MDGEWVDGNLFIDEKKDKHEILVGYVNYRIGWGVYPASVGQFTGLLDKNGKRIFEGDIVMATYRFNKSVICSYSVEYLNGAFMLKQKGVNYHIYFTDWPERIYYLEVLGNIHDNPELLRGE